MSDKPNRIGKVKVEIPSSISTTPEPNMEEYNVGQVPKVSQVVKVAKATIFQRIINWLLTRNKGKIIAYLLVALRGIVYPFDVYEVDNEGNWKVDPEENRVKDVKWASQIAKFGSLITFVIAYIFNEPIKDFTGKGFIEWVQLLINVTGP